MKWNVKQVGFWPVGGAKGIMIYYLVTMNVCSKFDDNPSGICQDICGPKCWTTRLLQSSPEPRCYMAVKWNKCLILIHTDRNNPAINTKKLPTWRNYNLADRLFKSEPWMCLWGPRPHCRTLCLGCCVNVSCWLFGGRLWGLSHTGRQSTVENVGMKREWKRRGISAP